MSSQSNGRGKKKGDGNQQNSLTSLVTGTVAFPHVAADFRGPLQPQQEQPRGTFTGILDITNFVVQNGVMMAVGTLSGTLTDASGNVIQTIEDLPVALQVTGLQATCPILGLTLGPLHLDLLGLVVDLNQVVLNINAVAAPGNLLGNLLCAVANLLDGGVLGGLLQSVTGLLNQVLGAL